MCTHSNYSRPGSRLRLATPSTHEAVTAAGWLLGQLAGLLGSQLKSTNRDHQGMEGFRRQGVPVCVGVAGADHDSGQQAASGLEVGQRRGVGGHGGILPMDGGGGGQMGQSHGLRARPGEAHDGHGGRPR